MSGDPETEDDVVVRVAREDDADHAAAASALIEEAAREFDMALRPVEFLRGKIRSGRAAIALAGGELVGFGYWSEWEGGRFVSHSGLVVRNDQRGRGLGRRLKLALFEASRRRFPDAILMSLTTSSEVKELNLSLGFQPASIDQLTTDPAFWESCRTCRNYHEAQRRGEQCCCDAMILFPREA